MLGLGPCTDLEALLTINSFASLRYDYPALLTFLSPCYNKMLCERCRRFDIQAFGRDPYPYRGVPFLSVVRSANRCSFCSLLLEGLYKAGGGSGIKSVIRFYQRFQQVPTREFLSLETLKQLPYFSFSLIESSWINFAVTKATKQPVAGSDGLNIASINAFIGPVDKERKSNYVRFHVAADQGEISLFRFQIPLQAY